MVSPNTPKSPELCRIPAGQGRAKVKKKIQQGLSLVDIQREKEPSRAV
jgi:hypothetical protein